MLRARFSWAVMVKHARNHDQSNANRILGFDTMRQMYCRGWQNPIILQNVGAWAYCEAHHTERPDPVMG